jgi:hypothetical protein
MTVVAKLYRDDRAAERHAVELDATLRDRDVPHDVLIEDLSASGFRMLSAVDLAIGAPITLGLPTVGRRMARVVRQAGEQYGCEFVVPLTNAQVEAALAAPAFEPINFPDMGTRVDLRNAPEPEVTKLPRPVRVAVIVALAASAWAVAIAGWSLIS